MRKRRALPAHMATALDYVTIRHAAAICHTPWKDRDAGVDEQRRLEAIEDSRRERDESRGDLMGATNWEE